jgi:glycerol-3-phosphate dehydrogenase
MNEASGSRSPGIVRDVHAAADRAFDVIVVGGGVYGIAALLEAARRGRSALLLERDDFGAATSWNSLRIVHGGLRYLQKLDLHRFRESVAERRWFCANFPDLVRPLTCLLPLYGQGLKRPTVFRVALAMNDFLSRRRNEGVPAATHLAGGRVLSRDETITRFPQVDGDGLRGAGLWHDAVMVNSQRVLMEMLRWAGGLGAAALNYVEATELIVEGGTARGVAAVDRQTGAAVRFTCREGVINTTGPWSRVMAQKLAGGGGFEHVFRPSLACNVLLDRPAISDCAVAVQPRVPGSRVYFLVPWHGRIFAGTYHAPWHGEVATPAPSAAQLDAFLSDLNTAVPGLDVTRADVLRVYAGLLPAREAGGDELAVREVIVQHGSQGGPTGLVSVSGVKFTTARLVGQKALTVLLGGLPAYGADSDRRIEPWPLDLADPGAARDADEATLAAAAARMVECEAAVHLDDVLLRRSDWGADPRQIEPLGRRVAAALGWSDVRLAEELARFEERTS